MALEIENCFLSGSDDKTRLAEMLAQVMQNLNLHKMCTLTGKLSLRTISSRGMYSLYDSLHINTVCRFIVQREQ